MEIWFVVFSICLSFADAVCPSGCSCRARYVDCVARGHTHIPSFSASNVAAEYDVLDLRQNSITSLNNGSFTNAPFKTVYLSNNGLNDSLISTGAFEGLKDSVTYLDLSHNSLHHLPAALKDLNKIEDLDVSHNPMLSSRDFKDDVMKAMGDTITSFTFGSDQLFGWPTTLNHFVQLQRLHVDEMGRFMKVLPPEAFHGFETTLLHLTIEHTHLVAVPIGISRLRNLEELHFDDNPEVTDRGVLIQSFPLSSHKLRTVSLNADGLTKFPPVLKYLRGLSNLSLDRNVLDFLSDASISGNVTVVNLTLIDCGLDRIPGALADLDFLTTLDLSKNAIRTIEQNDLRNLPNLQHLKIQNASLEYISNTALENLHNLVSLDFKNTKLTQVPQAVNLLHPCVAQLHLDGNKIDCMCETLVWLANKTEECLTNRTPMTITGECDTIDSKVNDYVTNYVPKCPQYKEERHIAPYDGH
ncbi:leucine-rich repeat and death domain-containing protein 1-like [Saccostrea cucullata]|uniref:leucine-rich repeat and death domain-containing protein 1-like n=1 Tax=Saccostrea cuccullata TaxID=36930 RepID=UPI002ED0341C